MKFLFIVLCFYFLMGAPVYADCERPLRVAWNAYPPYAFKTHTHTVDGLDIRILRQLSLLTNCPLTLVEVPPKRTFNLMRNGLIDITAAASKTSERQQFSYFTIPYRRELMTLFGKINNDKLRAIHAKEDLAGAPVSILKVRSAWYGPYIEQLEKDPDTATMFQELASPSGRFKMLWFDRVDLVIADALAGSWETNNMHFDKIIQPLPIAINDNVVHLMFSKESMSEEIVRNFNSAIQTFNSDAGLDIRSEIYNRFIPQSISGLYDPPPQAETNP